MEGPSQSLGNSSTACVPPLPVTLASHHPSGSWGGLNPASKHSSERRSSRPQPLPPPHPPPGFAAAAREALGTSQNREQLPTSGCRRPRGSGRTGCGRRGRGSALACLLPSPSGKLRPGAGATSPGCKVRMGPASPGPPSVQTPVRAPSTTRAARSPGRAGRGAGLRASAPPGNARRTGLGQLAAKVVVSQPALASHLRDTPSRRPGSRALTSGPPCAHPLPLSPAAPRPPTPCGSSRSPSRTPTRARGAPSPPRRSPGLSAAPAPGFWRPGAPAPGRDPLPPARRGAEAGVASAEPRSAGGARRGAQRRGAGRGRSLARSL